MTKLKLADSDGGTATADLAANVGVKYDASNPGQIVVTGIGDHPLGVTQEAAKAGTVCTFWVKARAYVSAPGVAAGDLVKCGANGTFVPEASVTTLTAATVGQAMNAADSSNCADIRFF